MTRMDRGSRTTRAGLVTVLFSVACTFPTVPVPDFQVMYRVAVGASARHSAFPGLVVVGDSDLVVVFREGADHISRTGRIALARSSDAGRTFTDPVTIVDTPLDDRDPAITRLRDGRLALNFFASGDSMEVEGGTREEIRRLYVTFSSDEGRSWSPARQVQQPLHEQRLASRSQLLEVDRGALLWPTYHAEHGSSLLYRSRNGGRHWEFFSVLADSTVAAFGEPSLIRLSSGKLLASLRTRPHRGGGMVYLSESDDAGRTWSLPQQLPIWGFPRHLLQINDYTLLMTYGYRRKPFGVRFAISYDEGDYWLSYTDFTLDGRSTTNDAGYPQAALLPDGSVYVVYYLTLGVGKIQVWGLRFTMDLP